MPGTWAMMGDGEDRIHRNRSVNDQRLIVSTHTGKNELNIEVVTPATYT